MQDNDFRKPSINLSGLENEARTKFRRSLATWALATVALGPAFFFAWQFGQSSVFGFKEDLLDLRQPVAKLEQRLERLTSPLEGEIKFPSLPNSLSNRGVLPQSIPIPILPMVATAFPMPRPIPNEEVNPVAQAIAEVFENTKPEETPISFLATSTEFDIPVPDVPTYTVLPGKPYTPRIINPSETPLLVARQFSVPVWLFNEEAKKKKSKKSIQTTDEDAPITLPRGIQVTEPWGETITSGVEILSVAGLANLDSGSSIQSLSRSYEFLERSFPAQPVPEPGIIATMLIGVSTLLLKRRKSK